MDFKRRIEKLRENLMSKKLDGFLLINTEHSDSANLRYLTGFAGSFGILVVTKDQEILLTDSRYLERVKQETFGQGLEIHEVKGKFTEGLAELLQELKLKQLGINSLNTSLYIYNELKGKLNSVKLVPLEGPVELLRRCKDEDELDHIKKAVKLTDEAFLYILDQVKLGMTERELAWELEKYMRRDGTGELAFPIIVASGPNSALPHALSSFRKIKEGDLLLLDFGARYDGYCADMTRVVAIGKVSDEQKKIYSIVLEAQERALLNIKAGMKGKEADQIAREVIEKAGYGENFGHGLGHGIGLEGHEVPRLSPQGEDELQPGMTVTVEPGIYLPGWGGVRIEDLVVIEKDGCRILTGSEKKLQVI